MPYHGFRPSVGLAACAAAMLSLAAPAWGGSQQVEEKPPIGGNEGTGTLPHALLGFQQAPGAWSLDSFAENVPALAYSVLVDLSGQLTAMVTVTGNVHPMPAGVVLPLHQGLLDVSSISSTFVTPGGLVQILYTPKMILETHEDAALRHEAAHELVQDLFGWVEYSADLTATTPSIQVAQVIWRHVGDGTITRRTITVVAPIHWSGRKVASALEEQLNYYLGNGEGWSTSDPPAND